jgi:ribosomal protein S18 acetylase RimI-like enzyme
MYTLQQLSDHHLAQYKQLVLEALIKYPEAFSFAYKDVIEHLDDFWKEKMSTIYGCFDPDTDKLVSIIGLQRDTGYSTHCADLYFIYVTPKFQGLGIGKFMLIEIEKISMLVGIEKLFLTLVHTNQAFELYKQLGYTVTGYEQDIRRVEGKRYDRYCMQKNIV